MIRSHRLVIAACVLLLAGAARLPAQGGPTLEQILSAPFPAELLASRTGGKLAWTQNARGVRNIWVAEPPAYRGRQVTRYEKDDGQTVGGLEWTPDAKALVYVRGGGPNGRGETPNPASDPAGAEQAVWRVALDGGDPVKIGNGGGAVVSPQGDGVAFVRGGQIWWAPLDGSREPQILVRARGNARSLRWSPDGARLAFISSRGDHSFIGVYDVAGKTLRWISPSVDEDGAPVWSPDGKRLAFIRQPTNSKTTQLFYARRSGHPWSILVADPANGQAKTVWTAREGTGSVFSEMVAENQLLWGAGDRLVFPWEGDGWLHLYSIPADPVRSDSATGAATLLTPGDFEIETVILTPGRREVLVSSNQGDIDRRHLWRVAVAGGRPVPVTSGKGIEWLPAVIGDGGDGGDGSGGKALAYLRAGARRPAEAVIRVGDGPERALVPDGVPADFPEAALVEPEPVVFNAADGMRIHGQLFLPRGLKPGERRPGLLFLHGGSHRQMLLGWHYSPYYNNAYGMNQYLASRGYVVLAVNYRAGTGYGMEFREALSQGAGGASEFYDVLGAGVYLRQRPEVDPDRIGLWGGSYGGLLTAMGLARASHLFKAGVDLHGVHDWNVGIQTFFPDYNPLEHPEQARLAFESSPLAWVDGWRSPVLVIHGDDDRNVDFSQTVRLVEALRERKVEVEQLILPDEVHGFLTWTSWISAYRATADFFERKLAGQGGGK
jgi:dipeptidyl aminopeptidase/acylaminoacyl peptidase